jgi:hypothetical protein
LTAVAAAPYGPRSGGAAASALTGLANLRGTVQGVAKMPGTGISILGVLLGTLLGLAPIGAIQAANMESADNTGVTVNQNNSAGRDVTVNNAGRDVIAPRGSLDGQKGWLCVADQATGFYYRKSTGSWSVGEFKAGDRYIVRPPNAEDIKDAEKFRFYSNDNELPAYVVRALGKSDDMSLVPEMCRNPPDARSGIMICQGGLTQFAVNTRLLRMQRYYGLGYLHQDSGAFEHSTDDEPAAPYIEIGQCSSL